MLTHNTIVALLWLVVFASGGMFGRFISWRRFSRQLDDAYDDGYDRGWDDRGLEFGRSVMPDGSIPLRDRQEATWDTRPAGPALARRTILLEPGPTIYPELRALAGEVLDGPEKPAKASESTWYRTTWLDLERRYPIRQDSPRGIMTEALR